MTSVKTMAHRAGVLYFVFAIVAIVGEFLLPGFGVPGDAAATARNVTEGEAMYRFAMLTGLVTLVLFIFLVVSLYTLLKDVDGSQAMLMLSLVLVGVAVALSNLLHKFAPLALLSGADYLSVFTKPQLDALSLGFLRFHSGGSIVTLGFWGLWLFPFGLLVIRSGFLPKVLGILLLVAGFAYVTTCVTSLVLPDYRRIVSRIVTPLYLGEVPIIFWLLIKGARVPGSQAQSTRVG